MKISKKELVAMIDSTLLKPEATLADVELLCEEAVMYHFGAVCVRPCDVRYVAKLLEGTNVKVCTVIGFPWGIQSIETKVAESYKSIDDGSTELDMVINRGYIKEKDYQMSRKEIESFVNASKQDRDDTVVKVILETCKLTDEEIVKACLIAKDAGLSKEDYIKTSTGLYEGATVKAVELIKETVPELGIKASGGIRDWDTAYKMIEAGATRLGTSSGVMILDGFLGWKRTH